MIGHLQTITEAVHALRYEPITVGERAEAYEAITRAALAMAVPGSNGERPTFPAVWMGMARMIAERATCPRLHVGAVIVSADNVPLVMAYNGAPPKKPHCDQVGCLIDPATGRCSRTIHAERNALNHAARYGISIAGATMYVTAEPCERCATDLTTSGIVRVVYADPYPRPAAIRDEVSANLADAGIAFERMGGR